MANPYLEKLVRRQALTRSEARQAFDWITSGMADGADIRAFLAALVAKGETVEEIVGAAEAMRARVTSIRCAADAIDTCGTGGDGISTFNVSTTAAIIAAAAGATVAKHGNMSHTRVSGSAEVLSALGVNIDAPPETVERCLREVRIGFLFARKLHPAMKHAAAARQALGIRTIINLLGPLTNPAGVRRQVIGVPRPELTETLAEALRQLGSVHVMVVHGSDGLCDLTVTGETRITELMTRRGGIPNSGDQCQEAIRTYRLSPEDVGLSRGRLADLVVDSPIASAAALRCVLSGEHGPPRDHALLNAAAALVVAGFADRSDVGGSAVVIPEGANYVSSGQRLGKTTTPTPEALKGRTQTGRAETLEAAERNLIDALKRALALAAEAVDDGRAQRTLDRLIEVSHQPTEPAA